MGVFIISGMLSLDSDLTKVTVSVGIRQPFLRAQSSTGHIELLGVFQIFPNKMETTPSLQIVELHLSLDE